MKNAILRGTFILTIAGFITKIIGFYYRIFLSNTIGSEGMGMVQLIMPISALSFSLCAAGIQTAISKYTAFVTSSEKSSGGWLISGLLISMPISFLIAFVTYFYAPFIADRIFLSPACAPLIKIMAFSVPLASFHSCVNGYYLGLKRAGVSAFSQMIEQIARVLCVYYVVHITLANNQPITAIVGVYGLVAGEFASFLLCAAILLFDKNFKIRGNGTVKKSKKIFFMSVPLTTNKILLHLFQSAEAILIPAQLALFGLNHSEALSVYGILTGMAMPIIMFPATITNSASVMLLPTVSKAQSANNSNSIVNTISASIHFSLIMGIFCTGMFLVYGAPAGAILFHNNSVKTFVTVLAWLCPFMYISTTLGSILNGLGKTTVTCIQNTLGILIRICFIVLLVPKYGIIAYLWGLLASTIFVCFTQMFSLRKLYKLIFNPYKSLVFPFIYILLSIGVSLAVYIPLRNNTALPEILNIIIGTVIGSVLYCAFAAVKLISLPSKQ